ncbi:MAG: hypothetical protein AAB903_00120 [Patescibacteria group bacterium]
MRIFVYGFVLATLIFPLASYATPPACPSCPITSVRGVVQLITAIVTQLQIVFWIVAAGSAIYAAFLFIRGGSSSESLKKAKNQIIYTVVAVALGVVAYGIPALVDNFLRLRA